MMRHLTRLLATLIALVLIGYFAYAAATIVRRYDLTPFLSGKLAGATAFLAMCYGLVIPLSSWAWRNLLSIWGERLGIVTLAVIMAVSQFAKYVPGNVFHILGRSALALARGIRAPTLFLSLTAESLLAVVASITVAMLSFAVSDQVPPLPFPAHGGWWVGAAAMAVVGTAALPLMEKALRVLPGLRHEKGGASIPVQAGVKIVFLVFVTYCVNYLLIGLGLWVVAHTMGQLIHVDYWYLTATFAIAWAVGFITPAAPAGLGVREAAMMLMLSGVAEESASLVLTASARLATLAADAVWFGAGAVYLRYAERRRNGS